MRAWSVVNCRLTLARVVVRGSSQALTWLGLTPDQRPVPLNPLGHRIEERPHPAHAPEVLT